MERQDIFNCVLIISHTRFRVNLHSVVAWMSRSSWNGETDRKSETDWKSVILKITWYQLFSKFSTFTRWHIDNSIWKTRYSWRFYRHESTYALILSWINIMKRKWVKMPYKLLVAQKNRVCSLEKTFARHFTFIIFFFLFERNLVFKLNLLLIE